MKNREKSFAIIVPSIIFILLYLLLSVVFDYATHRNHIPIKESIISWQEEKDSLQVETPVREVDYMKDAGD